MKIVGIDYSMSCPAMCLLDESLEFTKSRFYILSDRKKDCDAIVSNVFCRPHALYKTETERFDKISEYFISILEKEGLLKEHSSKVYLEDYSMGSKGKVFNIAENTGILKFKLHQNQIPLITIPPTVIKKFASGKGNSDKEGMYKAFLDRGNPDITKHYYVKLNPKITSPVSDIVDSYFIALYGAQDKT